MTLPRILRRHGPRLLRFTGGGMSASHPYPIVICWARRTGWNVDYAFAAPMAGY